MKKCIICEMFKLIVKGIWEFIQILVFFTIAVGIVYAAGWVIVKIVTGLFTDRQIMFLTIAFMGFWILAFIVSALIEVYKKAKKECEE